MKKQRIRLPSKDGMLRFWRLNASGTDEIGGNTLSLTNVTNAKTPRGYQTYYATANGSSSATNGNTASGARTLFFWIYPTANNTTFLTATGISVTINASSQIATSGLTGVSVSVNGQATASVTLNAWNFVAITHDSASYASINVFASSYVGNAQEVGVFNRVLSADEIRDWYLEGLRALGGSSLSGLMDGLVAYYDFRGDANDIISGYDGTVNGATLTTDRFGTANSAYNFPAGAVILPPSNSQTYRGNDLTVVATVKIPANDGSGHVVYSTGYLWFNIDSVNISSEHYPTGYTSGVHGKNAGDIVQCVWIKSSTAGVLLYVDGTLVASNPSATGDASIYDYPTIGYRRWQGSYIYPFLSDLYDLQIYNGVISPERIKAMAELSKQSKLLPFA